MAIRLLNLAQLMALPPIQWLLEGFLPQRALALIYGESGAGKSFVALDLALSIASGREWGGRSCERVPVLYVVGEGLHGVRERAIAWCRHHNVEGTIPITFVAHAVQISNLTQLDELKAAIRGLPEAPGLIVLDTFSRCAVGLEENSAQQMGLFVAALDSLRHEVGATVAAVHHTGKQGGSERGSSALRAAMDAVIKIQRSGSVVVTTCDKMKDGPEFAPLLFDMRPGELGSLVLVGKEGGQKGTRLGRHHQAIVDALHAAGSEGLPSAEIKARTGVSEGSYDRLRRDLQTAGLIEPTGSRGHYRLTSHPITIPSEPIINGSPIPSSQSPLFRGDGDGLERWDGLGAS